MDAQEFQRLSQLRPDEEWLVGLGSESTRKAYRIDSRDFLQFIGAEKGGNLELVAPGHVAAWRGALEKRCLGPNTIRRKMAAVSSLFSHLHDTGVVRSNPTTGIKRPRTRALVGSTPTLSDEQARQLLDAPATDTVSGLRDRAIVAVLLYHGLRRRELISLRVRDVDTVGGVPHLAVQGKGGKQRYLPVHPEALRRINTYLDMAGHRDDREGPLFRPVKNPRTGVTTKALSPSALYHRVVRRYLRQVRITTPGICVHSLRVAAATSALRNGADLVAVQGWLGHASVSTTRLYDRRVTRPEDSPTFKVAF